MNRQNFVSLLLLLIVSHQLFSQEKTIYFDEQWKETTKNKAVFYRPLPLPKIGNLEFLRDYYFENKNLQMQGYYADGIEKNYVGEIFWHEENGDDSSFDLNLNKTDQKVLNYYFDNGKLWKSVEYGDLGFKNGKTTEYKTDGSLLGISTYKDGTIISGITGKLTNSNSYDSYNIDGRYDRAVQVPEYKGQDRKYTVLYYWKSNLKTAAELTYINDKLVLQKDFDKQGNLIQKIDSTSYYYPEHEQKNGKEFNYILNRSSVSKSPTYTEYQSYPLSDAKILNITHILLYAGSIHFLEIDQTKKKFRETEFNYFEDNNISYIRSKTLYEDEAWYPIEIYQNKETQLIPISEIESYSKEEIYKKKSKSKWNNPYLKDKPISEEIYFASPDYIAKKTIYKSSGKVVIDEKNIPLVYVEISPQKYIMLLKTGGYFIPMKSKDLLEIPFYTNSQPTKKED